jgi:hypothetical protein
VLREIGEAGLRLRPTNKDRYFGDMQDLKIRIPCNVPGCFKDVEVNVLLDAVLPKGWHLSKLQVRPAEAKGVCPDHSVGEIAAGRVLT